MKKYWQIGYWDIDVFNKHYNDWESAGTFYEPYCNTISEVKDALMYRLHVEKKKDIRVKKLMVGGE